MTSVRRNVVPIFGAFLLLVLAATSIHADRRLFVHNYEPVAYPAGTGELEFYTTINALRDGAPARVKYQNQIEFEYNPFSRMNMGVYLLFEGEQSKVNGALNRTFSFRAIKFKTIFNFLDAVRDPIGLSLYLEPIWDVERFKMEGKLLIGKALGAFHVATNQIFEWSAFFHKDSFEFEYKPNLALGYEFNSHWFLGLEMIPKFKMTKSNGTMTKSPFSLVIGPTVNWQTKSGMWFGFNFGLETHGKEWDRLDIITSRLIVAVPFGEHH